MNLKKTKEVEKLQFVERMRYKKHIRIINKAGGFITRLSAFFYAKYEKGESENVVECKQRGGGLRMNHTEKTIPVWEKYSLNVSEAAEYYGIGEKRLRQIAGENEGADFILEVGSHIRFKRKLFEDYLDTASTV